MGGFQQFVNGKFNQVGFGSNQQLNFDPFSQLGFNNLQQGRSGQLNQDGFNTFQQQSNAQVNQVGFGGFQLGSDGLFHPIGSGAPGFQQQTNNFQNNQVGFAASHQTPTQVPPPFNFFNQPTTPLPNLPPAAPNSAAVTQSGSGFRWTGPTEAPYTLPLGVDTPQVQAAKENFFKLYNQAVALNAKLGFDGKGGPNPNNNDFDQSNSVATAR